MTQEIQKRIELIQRGKVPEGYKRTKVGIVPTEWENYHFSDLFVPYCEHTQDLDKYPLYSLTIEDGITAKTERYERSHLVKKEDSYKIVRPNDFAYNPMNLRFGAVSRHKGNDCVCVSGYYDIFTTKYQSDLLFMDTYLVSNRMLVYYNKVSTGSLIEKQRVHFSQFLEFRLPLPNIKERERIAQIFNAQDRVILLYEKMLEQKKKQKNSFMQQLFGGRKRLKGFAEKPLHLHLDRIIRETANRCNDGILRNVMSISNTRGFIPQTEQFDKAVASDDTSNYKIVKRDTFAFNPSRINVGSLALYKGDSEIIVSPMYSTFEVNEGVNVDYMLYWFKSFEFNSQLKKYLSGSVRDSLNISDLMLFDIKLPCIEEQVEIAKVLSVADKEIVIIQKAIEQEKQKKKAMVQLLLTGIVRI